MLNKNMKEFLSQVETKRNETKNLNNNKNILIMELGFNNLVA